MGYLETRRNRAYILTPDNRAITFDVVVSETHEASVTITEHPVEKGADVSDNIRPNLNVLVLAVFVSNAPLAGSEQEKPMTGDTLDLVFPTSSDLVYQDVKPEVFEAPFSPTPGRVFSEVGNFIGNLLHGKPNYRRLAAEFSTTFNAVLFTFEALNKLRVEGTLVAVITSSKLYENMAVEKVTLNRTEDDGTGGSFTIEFKEVRLVDTKVVDAPVPAEDRGKKTVNKGPQGPKKETPVKQSVGRKLNQALGDPLGIEGGT